MFERARPRASTLGDEELALDAIRDEGPGGMFLAADHTLAHFRDVDVHEPAVPLAVVRDVGEAGRRPRPSSAAMAEWKRLLESWEDPGIDPAVDEELQEYMARRKAELEDGVGRARPPRHPLRAGPDRAEDAAQPLLPGAALHRLRRREAVDAGGLPGHEGRGRLGRGVHRVLLDQRRVRRVAVRVGAAVGRRGRARAAADDRGGARARRAGRRRAVARRRSTPRRRESRLPPLAPSQIASDFDGITVCRRR